MALNFCRLITKHCLPVRHPHDHTLHSAQTGHVDDGLEGRDERFAAFQTESFLWRPLPLEKLLEPVNRWWCCCFILWLRITAPPPTPETPPAAALHACAVNYWGVLRNVKKHRQTLWIESFWPEESSSPPDWTAWLRVSQTFVWSTGTAPRR